MVSLVNKSILQSLIITGVQLEGGGEVRDLSCPLTKTGKDFPDFKKKCPDGGHIMVKFLIKNASFRFL